MFADPLKNLRAFGLREDSIIADLGAGTGFYSVAAGRLAPAGKVYAIDVQRDYLETIKRKAKHEHLHNVETLWGNIEKPGGTKIGDNIVDRVIASNVLFQVEDKDKFLTEAKRILKPGGALMLIDWSDTTTMGIKNIIPKGKAREMMERKGLIYERDIDAGAHHYGMIFKKNQ